MTEQKQGSRREQSSGTVMASGMCDKSEEPTMIEVNRTGVRVPEEMRLGAIYRDQELGVGRRS